MSQTVTPNDLCKVLGIGDELDRVLVSGASASQPAATSTA
jgi:hypothetical protein